MGFFIKSIFIPLFLIFLYFPDSLFGDAVDVSIIEKKIDSIGYITEMTKDKILDQFYENNNIKKESKENYGTVFIHIYSYICKFDQASLELSCSNHYLCIENYCSTFDSITNMFIQGNQPSFSTTYKIHSDPELPFSKLKISAGEFDIMPYYNYRITDICKKIKPDIFSFDTFSVGNVLSHNPDSILCINIGNECHGIIASDDTKLCEITKVTIKDYKPLLG
ncbi:MAG: hypothetical protein MRJ93_01830 [Nitrososphaeraceae archaeon]|nr:hypothetical protein [Nitrososphaeraceae archaeon]